MRREIDKYDESVKALRRRAGQGEVTQRVHRDCVNDKRRTRSDTGDIIVQL